jgi:hypothetical protein
MISGEEVIERSGIEMVHPGVVHRAGVVAKFAGGRPTLKPFGHQVMKPMTKGDAR